MEDRRRRKNDRKTAGGSFERFGALAVHMGFITLEQAQAAISEQMGDDVEGRDHRLIGAILFDKGWLTEEQIQQVLRELPRPIVR